MPHNFDWASFFRANRIDYRGESSREILIKCPWCGNDDPSEHLSVNLEGKGYRCFRSGEHRGRSPARLVQILLRCSMDHARNICGMTTLLPSGGNFLDQVNGIFQESSQEVIHNKFPKLPEEFLPLRDKPSAWPYLSYMKKRGYELRNTLKLSKLFDLHYCSHGPFQGRIIFPVKRRGKLVNWTGRTIHRDTLPRYRSHTTRPELAEKLGLEPAADSISNLLLWHDLLESSRADVLVITEGPFDALRVNHFGLNLGVIATCLFTMQASLTQIESLRNLVGRFKRTVLLLDKNTLDKAVSLSLKIPELRIITLPDNIKDPGLLDLESFAQLGLTSYIDT